MYVCSMTLRVLYVCYVTLRVGNQASFIAVELPFEYARLAAIDYG